MLKNLLNSFFYLIPKGAPECLQYTNISDATSLWKNVTPIGPSCDEKISGWYRFINTAGYQMESNCTAQRRPYYGYACGTIFRGWMKGSHPFTNEGKVERKICFSYSHDCKCQFETTILVRNCGRFYVYRLPRVPICHARYCTAKEIRKNYGKFCCSLILLYHLGSVFCSDFCTMSVLLFRQNN